MRTLLVALVMGLSALPAQVRAEGAVAVGVTTTGVPFTFVETASQKTTGAMVDIAEAILTGQGLKPQFELTAFSALIPALLTKKIRIISAGMLVTDKRKEVVAFSAPVYSYGEAMFVSAGDGKDMSLNDLKGEVVGAQAGTAFVTPLQNTGLFKEVKLYESIADIMRDVKLGRIKAGFGDAPIVKYQIAKNPMLGVRLSQGYKPMTTGDVALAVSKDDPDLLEKINTGIATIKGNGTLVQILDRYGLQN